MFQGIFFFNCGDTEKDIDVITL